MSASNSQPEFREILTDAVRYWEPRRVLYNGILLVP